MNTEFNTNNEGPNKTNSLNKKRNVKNSIFRRKEVAKLIAALFIVSVPSISFAKGGVYINDGTDRGCSYIYDTAEGLQRGTYDECTNPSTNTTRSLFFGPTGTGTNDDNASKSLSLGGNLMVNGGGVQLTDLNDKSYSMRIGSNSTMSAKGGKNSIAIGSAQNGSDIGNATTASANQAIAIGSSTESSSENAVAIGTQSVAKAKNSVALGAGSVADTQNTVSVGSSGNERKIVNVANAKLSNTSTDAVNGSQLFATNSNVTDNATAIETNKQNIASNTNDIATNANDIATNKDNIQINTDEIAKNKANITTNTTDIATNKADITTTTDNLTNLTNNINEGKVGLVQQDDASKNITVATNTGGTFVNLKGSDGDRTLSGVQKGAIAQDSTEAINGSQLFDTNSKVETNTQDIATNKDNIDSNTKDIATNKDNIDANTKDIATNRDNISTNTKDIETNKDNIATNTKDIETNRTNITNNTNSINDLTTNINSGQVGLVKQDPNTNYITVASNSGGSYVSFGGSEGNRILTDIKDGELKEGSSDAVTGGQLFETNTKVEANSNNIATNTKDIETNANNIAKNTDNIATNTKDIATNTKDIETNKNDITTNRDNITTNTNNIAKNTENITTLTNNINSGQVGLVKQDADTKEINVSTDTGGTSVNFKGTDGDRTLTGVKGGNVAKDSTDAVNGGQLFETNSKVEANTNAISKNTSNIEKLTNDMNSGQVGLVKQDADSKEITIASETGGSSVNLKGADGDRSLTGVKGGNIAKDSTDVVNGNQLFETNSKVETNTKDIATSKSQIESNTTAINTNKEDIKRLSSDIDNASVMKLSEDGSKLTLNDKAKGAENIDFAEKRVTGIGQAKNDTDAVNLSQAKSLNEQTLTSSKNYTDKRVTNLENYVSNETGRLDGRINDLDEKVNKGLASSAALNGLFQPYGVGKMNITAGVGGYSNKSAVAVGAGYRFNETVAIKGGVATTSGNGSSTMYNASVNFEW